MPWIKRNLVFVISLMVGVILIGGAAYFLYNKIDQNEAIRQELDHQVTELKRLYNSDPSPGDDTVDNVAAVKHEEERIIKLMGETRSTFAPVLRFPGGADDAQGFKSVLELTLAYLQQTATNAGITLPTGQRAMGGVYSFTFGQLRPPLQYPEGDIPGWLAQLSEVKTICDILFKAKINALEGIRRTPVAPKYDYGADFLPPSVAAISNSVAIMTPYEVTFRGFGSEISSVLQGFIMSSNCYIVKTISVEHSNWVPPVTLPQSVMVGPGGVPRPAAVARELTPDEQFILRYGKDANSQNANRYAPRNAAILTPGGAGAQTNTGPPTVLAEKPLRVTMLVEVVKLINPNKTAATNP